jgi:hypothetical protein
MEAIQAVRPATNNYNLIQPRSQRVDQAAEVFEIGTGNGQTRSFLNNLNKAFLRISSACALPRAG